MKRAKRNERRDDESGPRVTARSGARTKYKPPVVLIVDDVQDNRDLFAMVVERLGYRVEVAVDGLDGVACAQRTIPAVILMDLAMPNMNGFEAVRIIRTIPALASVHIIAVSAFVDAFSKQQALACGCDDVLGKPCLPDVLAEKIEAGLGQRRLRAPA